MFLSAHCLWKRLNIWKLVIFALFLKFLVLDDTIGRVIGAGGCVNGQLQQSCCSY